MVFYSNDSTVKKSNKNEDFGWNCEINFESVLQSHFFQIRKKSFKTE